MKKLSSHINEDNCLICCNAYVPECMPIFIDGEFRYRRISLHHDYRAHALRCASRNVA